MCHNINRLLHILPEQYQPVLNSYLSNILSSSVRIALSVKHLQPKATLPYATSTISVPTSDSNSSRDLGDSNNVVVDKESSSHKLTADNYCELFLASTTTRETQIESEVDFL